MITLVKTENDYSGKNSYFDIKLESFQMKRWHNYVQMLSYLDGVRRSNSIACIILTISDSPGLVPSFMN